MTLLLLGLWLVLFGLLTPSLPVVRGFKHLLRGFFLLFLSLLCLSCLPPAFHQPCERPTDCRNGEVCLPGLSLCTKACSSSKDCGCAEASLFEAASLSSPSLPPFTAASCSARCILFPAEATALCLRSCQTDADCPASLCRKALDSSGFCF